MKKIALFLLVSVVFVGCVKSLENEGIYTTTEYIGKVIEGSQQEPIPGVKVVLTDGLVGDTLTVTDQRGVFSVQITVEKIGDDDFLELVYEPLDIIMRRELVGLGEKTYDYGNLVLYEASSQQLPEVQTDSVVEVGDTYVVLTGVLISEGDSAVIELGFCVDTIFNPSFSDSSRFSKGLAEEGPFVDTITNLLPGTQYYYRAYARNVYGIVYGECKEFNTNYTPIEVMTGNMSEFIIKAHSVIGTGLLSCGGNHGVVCGLLWNTEESGVNLEQAIGKTEQEGRDGVFEATATGLFADTEYHLRAYAHSANDTVYGETITVKTKDGVARIETGMVTAVTANSARSGIKLLDDGGLDIISGGICWSQDSIFTLNHYEGSSSVDSLLLDELVPLSITELESNKHYYVKAYCQTEDGLVLGDRCEFTTLDNSIHVTTGDPSSFIIKAHSMVGTGFLLCGDNSDVVYGLLWNTDFNVTLEESLGHTVEHEIAGAFNSRIYGLDKDTRYYIRAYAYLDPAQVEYGRVVEVKTEDGVARVQTDSVSEITSNRALGGVTLLDDGGLIISSGGGICWSKKESFTLDDCDGKVPVDFLPLGESIPLYLSGLDRVTEYFAKAYCITEDGIMYGDVLPFLTKPDKPVLDRPTILNHTITETTASVLCIIEDDGGEAVTECGVIWSTNQELSFEESQYEGSTECDPSGNQINTEMTDLTPDTKYYVRAYAVNSAGVVESSPVSFTTLPAGEGKKSK